MAGRFLHKLLGRAKAALPEVQTALGELQQLAEERPSLANLAALLSDVLPIICGAVASTLLPPVSSREARDKLSSGIPILRGIAFPATLRQLDRRWQQLCQVMAQHRQGPAPASLARAVRDGRIDLGHWLGEILVGRTSTVRADAEGSGLDIELAGTLLRFTLFQTLVSAASALEPLRAGVPWVAGYCPICGSCPLLAEFRGLEQRRWLRCGWCAAGWEAARQLCPYCGNRDHRTLGYLHVEGEESQRKAATCDQCHGYVKTLTTLAGLSPPSLLVADLATLHLDLAAGQKGLLVPPPDALPI